MVSIPETEEEQAAEQAATQEPEEQPVQNEDTEPIVDVDQETTTENLPEKSYQEEETPTEPVEDQEDVNKDVETETSQKNAEETQEICNIEEESPAKEQSSDSIDAGVVCLDEPMETEEIEQPIAEDTPNEKQISSQVKWLKFFFLLHNSINNTN